MFFQQLRPFRFSLLYSVFTEHALAFRNHRLDGVRRECLGDRYQGYVCRVAVGIATGAHNFRSDVLQAGCGGSGHVSEDIEKLRFNRCVAHIYEFANALGDAIGSIEKTPDNKLNWALREAGDILVQLFHPMMPHLAEECWAALGHKTLVASENWPKVESQLLIEDTITLPIQINGKKRAEVTVNRKATNGEIEAAVLALDAVKKALGSQSPKKVIVVPQRIVNVVV